MAIKINETIDWKSRKAKECRQEFTRLTNSCLSSAVQGNQRTVGTAADLDTRTVDPDTADNLEAWVDHRDTSCHLVAELVVLPKNKAT